MNSHEEESWHFKYAQHANEILIPWLLSHGIELSGRNFVI